MVDEILGNQTGLPRANNDDRINHVDGLTEDCSNSSVLAMELLQSCIKPLM